MASPTLEIQRHAQLGPVGEELSLDSPSPGPAVLHAAGGRGLPAKGQDRPQHLRVHIQPLLQTREKKEPAEGPGLTHPIS